MGLYDRDYYRDDDQPGLFGGQHSMVVTLIVINLGLFVVDILLEGELSDFLAAKSDLLQKPWNAWQLLTSGFAHDPRNFWHVGFNMFGLWLFGRDVEIVYGRKEFLRIYLTMIVFGSLVWVLTVNAFRAGGGPLMGASGAVTGMIILNVLHFPRRVWYVWGVFPVPAWVIGTLLIGRELLNLSHGQRGMGGPQIAYEVHLAGAAFAFIYYYTGWNLGRMLPKRFSLSALKLKPRPKLRVHEPEMEENLNDQVDRILEKISREGESSLTAQERRTLEDASRRYQQRRR